MHELLHNLGNTPIQKRAISNHSVLNEAFSYARPVAFSRGMRVDLNGLVVLFISGTGSINEHGATINIGDFPAQLRRVFSNITGLLESEGATWKDVVRTTCYFRDIDRDYEAFNEVRNAFFAEQGIEVFPASTAISAQLCRPELLIELDAIAMFQTAKSEG
ncbi:MAG TPA: RidA family protein [Terracidiphilus sp.]|nr:RidA family protein [Terracidiphilus sp.]